MAGQRFGGFVVPQGLPKPTYFCLKEAGKALGLNDQQVLIVAIECMKLMQEHAAENFQKVLKLKGFAKGKSGEILDA